MKKTSLEIEKQLLPRLKVMGFVLLFMAMITVSYAIFSKPYLSTVGLENDEPLKIEKEALGPDLEDTPTFMLTSYERINLYFIAGVFALVSCTLFITYTRKRAKIRTETESSPENG